MFVRSRQFRQRYISIGASYEAASRRLLRADLAAMGACGHAETFRHITGPWTSESERWRRRGGRCWLLVLKQYFSASPITPEVVAAGKKALTSSAGAGTSCVSICGTFTIQRRDREGARQAVHTRVRSLTFRAGGQHGADPAVAGRRCRWFPMNSITPR